MKKKPTPIEQGIKLTCKDCGNEFRIIPYSTVHPVRCKLCQNILEAKKSKESKQRIIDNNKLLAKSTLLKPKKGRQSQSKKLDKKLDEVWSLLVKKKAGYKCQVCFNTKNLNSHHIYSRGKFSVRWDIDNGICLCVNHHIGMQFSAHKTPVEFTDWLRHRLGDEFMQKLSMKASGISHFTVPEKEILLIELNKLLKC